MCLCWVEPEAEYEYENEVTTEVENEELSYDPIENSLGKMTEPGYHYYLCLLLEVSIYSFASMPMFSCQPPIVTMNLSNHPTYANLWLAK